MSLISEGISDRRVGPCRVLALKTDVQSVVTLRGFLHTWPDFAKNEELAQTLAVGLLDKGTHSRSKMEIAAATEDLGAQIGFSSAGTRIRFAARFLKRDLASVLALIAEQLRYPALLEEEFDKYVKQVDASLQRSVSNTGYRADVALSSSIYSSDHPGFALEPEAERAELLAVSLQAVRDYHAERIHSRPCTIVAVGDLEEAELRGAVEGAFGTESSTGGGQRVWSPTRADQAGSIHVQVEDRPNLDVRIGHGLPLKRTDPEYLPLFVGNFILGGNFSARLMSEVREKKGLTYGISSSISGVNAYHDGLWRISATFSSDRLEEGISATVETLGAFVRDGVTEAEVSRAIETLAGQYIVGLASTAGLASTLRAHAENGFAARYIDDYPVELRSVSVDAIRQSIRDHILPNALQTVTAGTR